MNALSNSIEADVCADELGDEALDRESPVLNCARRMSGGTQACTIGE